ncbi:MAG: LysM peptidoglycan-binding domain-containing protein [Clostridia bacterium]|nr:LysM peptidoglycan-binding domain-containing protein [Clostridia bacterium]
MDTEWIRENMETEQIIAAKPAQISVEAEAALPGGLREEARVYYADAAAALSGGELAGNRINVDGRITFHVLYAQGDLAKVNALETTADFSQTLALKEDGGPGAPIRLQPRAQVQHVSAKAFNGRLLLQAIVNLSADAAVNRTLSLIKDVEERPDIQKLTKTVSIQRTVGEGESQALVKEEFELSDVLGVKDTLFASAQAQAEDILGGADGQATVTGTVTIDAFHVSSLPGRPLVYTRHTMPYEQQVLLSGALGTALAAQTAVRDVAVLSQDGENGKIMRAEIQLSTALTAVEDSETTLLQDVFTTQGSAVETRRQQVLLRSGAVNETAAESGRLSLTLPEGSPRMKTALLGFLRPVLIHAERQKDKLSVDGVMDATLIYLTDDSEIPVSVQMEEPFHAAFSTQALPEDHLALSCAQVEPSAVTGDRAEMKYILYLQADGVRRKEAEVLTEAVESPAPDMEKGIILYYLQPGETVWDIAKRYRVPLEEITHLNPGLGADPAPGAAVLTFKR